MKFTFSSKLTWSDNLKFGSTKHSLTFRNESNGSN